MHTRFRDEFETNYCSIILILYLAAFFIRNKHIFITILDKCFYQQGYKLRYNIYVRMYMYKYLDEVRIHISAKFIDKFSSIVLHFLKYIRMLVGLKMKNASITISVCVQFLVSSSIFVIDTLLEEA